MKQKFQTLLQQIIKWRIILIALVVFGLFGFLLWQVRPLSNPEPDQNFLEKQRTEAPQKTQLNIEESLRERINKLSQPTVDVTPKNLGHNNPFNP